MNTPHEPDGQPHRWWTVVTSFVASVIFGLRLLSSWASAFRSLTRQMRELEHEQNKLRTEHSQQIAENHKEIETLKVTNAALAKQNGDQEKRIATLEAELHNKGEQLLAKHEEFLKEREANVALKHERNKLLQAAEFNRELMKQHGIKLDDEK